MQIVEPTFLVLVNIAENIHKFCRGDSSLHILNASMLSAGSVIETVRIFDTSHSFFENVGSCGNWNNIGVLVGRKQFQVLFAVEASINHKQNAGKL